MVADAARHILDVTGDVAAFHRQRTAIAGDRADRVLGDFLDTQTGHESPAPAQLLPERYAERATLSLTTSGMEPCDRPQLRNVAPSRDAMGHSLRREIPVFFPLRRGQCVPALPNPPRSCIREFGQLLSLSGHRTCRRS